MKYREKSMHISLVEFKKKYLDKFLEEFLEKSHDEIPRGLSEKKSWIKPWIFFLKKTLD